jgi:hypothetical protein
LTGEAAADAIDGADGASLKRFNVLVDRDIWPVPFQNCLAVRVDLAERDGSHSGSFEAEAEAADSAEEVEDIHVLSCVVRLSSLLRD